MFTDLLMKTDYGPSQFKPVRATRAWRRRRRVERLARISVAA